MKTTWKEPRTSLSVWLLAGVTLACLLPFLGKAFHMDDPLFIWTARHIGSHPLDFYGFSVNWSYRQTPMSVEMLNPPLASYYMAVVGAVLGWSEPALHFGFLLPALALVLGTYFMARRFCSHPFAAALGTIATPVFLLSSTSLMCDTMMAALWVWAVYFWMEGLEQEKARLLLLSATLTGACGLTKYFGMSLIPLLAAYTVLRQRRVGRRLLYLIWPVLMLAAYQWITARLYGRGLLWNATCYAATNPRSCGYYDKVIETLAFSGGCLFIILPVLPWLWGRRGLIAGVAGAAAAGWLMIAIKSVGGFPVVEGGHVKWLFLLQMTLFVIGGAIILALAVADTMRNRTPDSILLLFWVVGVLAFVGAINWTVSGRNILPLAPAAALLMVRRLEFRQAGELRRLWWPLGISLAVALMVAWGDWRLAGSAREMANTLRSHLAASCDHIAFEGHWGFQYYMEQLGAKPLEDRKPLALAPFQAVIVPMNKACTFDLPRDLAEPVAAVEITPSEWLSIQSCSTGAGYYSDYWGPAPFVFGQTSPEIYRIFKVK